MKFRSFLAALTAAALLSTPALAEDAYPNKPIQLIVPFGAGGTTDVIARALADAMGTELGQPIVVQNVSGASGMIGASRTARARADGYTLLFATNVQVINPAIRKVPYDAVESFTPIALIGHTANVLVVKGDSPFKTWQDYVAAAKATPGHMTYATPGVGTSTQFAAEQLGQLTGTSFTNVPYDSTSAMAQSVLSGNVQSTWLVGQGAEPYVKSGQLRALGIASNSRSPFLPNTPTFAEQGLKGLVSETWWAVYAPAKLPAPITDKLIAAVAHVLAQPTTANKLRQAGLDRPDVIPGGQLRVLMEKELVMYRDIVRQANIPQLD